MKLIAQKIYPAFSNGISGVNQSELELKAEQLLKELQNL
jgi:hypothetical protein